MTLPEPLSAAEMCEYAGHEWGDAGGGLRICLVCEAEEWAETKGDDDGDD
jgi:hypothetical protein